jgi:heterodisulfide reductase subunit A
MAEMIDAVTSNDLVDIRTGTEITAVEGSAGEFSLTLTSGGSTEDLEAGAVIVATGFQHFDPGRETQQYQYYEYEDVITIADAERMLKNGSFVTPSTGKPPERVAFVQCVGSRDRQIGNEYCSKVCCGISSKQAIEIRQMVPDARVFIFYIDMRMYGYWENEIYWPAQEEHKVNYVKGIITEVLAKNGRLVVRGEDTTMGRPMEVIMDVVILSVGMEPSAGTRTMADLLGLPSNKYGFIDTDHDVLDTVTTTVPGVFATGAAVGPADLDDSISSAGAAAAKAVSMLRNAKVTV